MAGKYLTTPNNRFIKAGNLKILGSTIVRNKLKQKNCRQTMIIVNKAMIPNVVENYLDLSENRPQVWCQLSSVSLLKWPFFGGDKSPICWYTHLFPGPIFEHWNKRGPEMSSYFKLSDISSNSKLTHPMHLNPFSGSYWIYLGKFSYVTNLKLQAIWGWLPYTYTYTFIMIPRFGHDVRSS